MKVYLDYKAVTEYAYRNCLCSKEMGEHLVECEDGEVEINPKDVKLDYSDLEELVDRYEDEIREILRTKGKKEKQLQQE